MINLAGCFQINLEYLKNMSNAGFIHIIGKEVSRTRIHPPPRKKPKQKNMLSLANVQKNDKKV